jgi:alkylation response protein AidB-like acyl-CoA dehydrogenase
MATPAQSSPAEAAAALAPLAAELAAEAERERRLPGPLVEALRDAGLFRLCVPASVGGLEASPRTLVDTVEALARGDAAAGWCVAIGATSGLLAGYLDPDAAREIYGDPAAIAGGVFAPRGKAEPTEAGYRVTGRWPFASGVGHCTWVMGGCRAGEKPDVLLAIAPASEVEVLDTWHVSGLRGTGSHDIAMHDLLVPAERTASLITGRPTSDAPLFAFPVFGVLAMAIAAVVLGAGRAALDDLVVLAGGKTPTLSSRKLAERATVQAETARAEAGLRAARALLHEAIDTAWTAAGGAGEITVEHRAALRLASTHAVEAGTAAVDAAYRLAGGSAIYDSNPLQRRFRDVHAATQHMLVAPATWELTGRLLLGLPTDVAQL